MKQKFLLSLFFVCAFMVTTRAQINKGSVWLGGSIGYNQTKNDNKDALVKESKTSSFNVSPSIGLAVKDNLIVGVRLSYGHDKSKNYVVLGSESKTNSYGGGVFIRQYIPVINRLYLFGDASALYASSKVDDSHSENTGNGSYTVNNNSKGWSTALNVTPGLAFSITKKFQIETLLNSLFNVGYSKTKYTNSNSISTAHSNSTSDSFNAGIFTDGKVQLNIGCRFLL